MLTDKQNFQFILFFPLLFGLFLRKTRQTKETKPKHSFPFLLYTFTSFQKSQLQYEILHILNEENAWLKSSQLNESVSILNEIIVTDDFIKHSSLKLLLRG